METAFRVFADTAPTAAALMIMAWITLIPYRKEPAAQALMIYLALVCFLLVANIMELHAPIGTPTIWYAKLQYISFTYLPIVWLSFCLRYTGWISWTRKWLIAIAVLAPLPLLVLTFTNEYHGFLWRVLTFAQAGGLSVLRAGYGPLYWFLFTYSWLFIGTGAVMVVRSYVTGQGLYYRQSLWMIIGLFFPAVTNLLNLTRIFPSMGKDFTPMGYAVSGLCFLAAMYIHRLFWIMPASRGVILQEIDIGILVIDRNGWIVDHNQMIDQLIGITEIAVGKKAVDMVDVTEFFSACGIRELASDEKPSSGMLEWKGRMISWSRQAYQGRRYGFIFTAKDITEVISLQAEIVKLKEEFINREKLASIGRLTATLAHEINNPLAYITADLRSLQRILALPEKNRLSTDITDAVSSLSSGLQRIEGVVTSLLAFSRKGSIETVMGEYDMHRGISITLEFMRFELHDSVQVTTILGDIPRIKAAGEQINQVFFNILSNALHAIQSEEGAHGEIKILTGRTFDSVWCEIENSGPPIPAEHIDRIFDLFFTTKEDHFGTGLGLNLCKDIIENHHSGSLTLRSANPVTFRIELPIKGPESDAMHES